jgi:hypothetical protein
LFEVSYNFNGHFTSDAVTDQGEVTVLRHELLDKRDFVFDLAFEVINALVAYGWFSTLSGPCRCDFKITFKRWQCLVFGHLVSGV